MGHQDVAFVEMGDSRGGWSNHLTVGGKRVRREWSSEGWYYRQNGQAHGPVSTDTLKELLTLGRLQPRQAVWQRETDRLVFVHAATAALGKKP